MSRFLCVFACCLLAGPSLATAQVAFDVVGTRALGMGGAFVAVADDATAVHWNPAGLLGGQSMGMTFEWDRFQSGNRKLAPSPGPRQDSSNLTSLGTWPVGLSYGRFKTTMLSEGLAGETRTESLSITQFGVTVLQTLVEGLVVGSTLKYVRGQATFGPVEAGTTGEALEKGADLDGKYRGTFDLDIGVMADLNRVRVGVASKNLRQPRFGESAETAITLKRRTRLGVAVFPATGLTLAMDLDLDTADLSSGLRRMIALGGESRLGARTAVRAGVRWSRDGPRRPIGAFGASVVLRRGVWLDGYYTQSRRDEDRGFGIAMRAGY